MSYRVLRQHILRFGYVRIKRRNESVINISGERKKFRCIPQNSFTYATELTIKLCEFHLENPHIFYFYLLYILAVAAPSTMKLNLMVAMISFPPQLYTNSSTSG